MGAPQYEQAGADIGGSGTINTIPRWTGASTLGDSIIVQNAGGTAIAIGDAAGVSYVGLVQVKRAGGAGWLTLDHTGGSYAEVQSYNVPLYLNRQGNNTILNATSGNVGIGTASPVGRTDIAGTSVDQLAWGLLSVRSSDAQGADKGGSLAFGGLYDATNSTHWAQISGRKENGTSGQYGGYLAFATRTNGAGANTERARIDSSGNLLMAGNGTAANPIIANSTGVSGMYFPSASTVAIAANGGIAATFSKVAGAGVALGGTTGLVFDASGTQQGVKLRATPDSTDTQTLDCYQENTWTPTLAGFGGTTPTVTASYTRVGRLVTVHVKITPTGGAAWSAAGGGAVAISLPAGIVPASDSSLGAGVVFDSNLFRIGDAWTWTNNNMYLSSIASTTATAYFSLTYRTV